MDLFILGNGFDKAHDIPCTYDDFCTFLKNCTNKELKDFAEKLEYIYRKEDLWKDFEKALGNPNLDTIRRINTLFDLNIFGKNFASNINQAFKEWAMKLDNYDRKAIYNLSKEDLYLNFNYTSTLEIQYGIDDVMHIHGFIGKALFDPNHKFIVGHGENVTKDSIELVKETKKQTDKIISNNIEYFNSLKNKNINYIKVIGFSYSDIDKNYFRKIMQVLPNVKWILGYYSQSDKINAEKYKNELKLNAEIIQTKELLVRK